MSRWKVKAPTLVILSILISVMLLIVVLPDVDLPDTAFHRSTAPVVVHTRANMAPSIVAVASLFQFPQSSEIPGSFRDLENGAATLDPNFRPILLRSIRR